MSTAKKHRVKHQMGRLMARRKWRSHSINQLKPANRAKKRLIYAGSAYFGQALSILVSALDEPFSE